MKYLLRSFLVMLVLLLVGLAWFSRQPARVPGDITGKRAMKMQRMPDDHEGRAAYDFMRLRNPYTGKIPDNIYQREREFAKTLPKVGEPGLYKPTHVMANTWSSRGPWNIGGRTRALGVDIRNNSILIAGGVSGGMWRSTNGGASWVKTTEPSELHSVTCLVQDTRPGKQDIWYYGSGELRGNSASGEGNDATFSGNGLFKSTDNGLTWNVIPSTATNDPQTSWANDFIWNVAIDPSNTSQDEVYFAYYGSIKRSTNGGGSFSRVLKGTSSLSAYTDVAVTSTGVCYATLSTSGDNPGIFRSTDGITWTNITPASFPGDYRRIVIGVAPSNENIVYFLGETPGSGTLDHSFWKYTYVSGDGSGAGGTWVNRSSNLPNEGGSVGDFDSQSSYDLICKVKPDDENVVFFGGTNLYRTNNGLATGGVFPDAGSQTYWIGGYSTANDVSITANHYVDQHAIVFDPTNPDVLFSGNDGGVFKAPNNTTYPINWTNLDNGYLTTQFYAIAIDHATNGDPTIIGGMQDNSTFYTQSTSPTTSWEELLGGDGCFCAIADGGRHWYSSWQNGGMFRDDWTAGGSYIGWSRIDPSGATGNDYLFVNPFTLDPANTDRMYLLEGKHLWYNSDVTAIPLGSWQSSTNWTKLTNANVDEWLSSVAVAKTPVNRVYYGSSSGGIYRLDNAPTNPSPVDIASGKGLPSGYVTCIAVDPHDGDKALVVYSNYEIPSIYYTDNAGVSWTNVSGSLEQFNSGAGNGPSCRWADILYVGGTPFYTVGTSTGLYSTWTLNGTSTVWAQEGSSTIGNVVVDMIKSRESDKLVVVGTHGYGVFSSTISTSVERRDDLPADFALSQNYPNPFNPSTTITYSLPAAMHVTLKVYDATGREIQTLADHMQEAGRYEAAFDGSRLASGLYICRINAGDFTDTKKMTLIK